MKETFTKLFGALMLVALLLGLVMPFQSAAAQEEIPTTYALTVAATDGDTVFGMALGSVGIHISQVGGPFPLASYTHYVLSRSDTEVGTKTILDAAVTDVEINTADAGYVAPGYIDTTATPGKEYFYWVQICDASSCSAFFNNRGWGYVEQVVNVANSTFASVNDYDKVVVTIDNGGFALPSGGHYNIFRKEAADAWPIEFTTSSILGQTTTLVYNDLTAVGQRVTSPLAAISAAKLYNYAVDACGAT